MPVHLVEVPALALVAFVIHHTRAGQCEQHRHNQVEIQFLFGKAQNILTPSHTRRHNQENHGSSKVFLFIGIFC